MSERLGVLESLSVESFHRVGRDVVLGTVAIDPARCKGCGLCVDACAASVLELAEKRCRMVTALPLCYACADCEAICPDQAIRVTGYLQFYKGSRYLGRGQPLAPRRF